MRKAILQEFVSLDGLAAGPNDSVDFVPASTQGDQSFGQRQMGFMDSIDLILLGRVTYTMFAGYWPNVTSGEDKRFADKLNAIPKVVFSRSLDRAPWGSWGSISLAQSLTNEGLIDEYQLVVCPVVLGSGKRLFGDKVDSFGTRLLSTESFDRGAVLLPYTAADA
jgi:dihydrofolate reductase